MVGSATYVSVGREIYIWFARLKSIYLLERCSQCGYRSEYRHSANILVSLYGGRPLTSAVIRIRLIPADLCMTRK